MKLLRFSAQLAFICNLFFIVCFMIQRTSDFIGQADLSSIVIILGWLVAPILNVVVNIFYGWILLSKSQLRLPLWLAWCNFLVLIIQFYITFL